MNMKSLLRPVVAIAVAALILLGAVTFGLLPLAAGLAVPARAGLLAVGGGVTFGILTWMLPLQRIVSPPDAPESLPLL